MNDQLTPEQLQSIQQMSKLTPGQSAMTLGSSNTLVGNMLKGYADMAKNVATGVAQSEVGLVSGLGKLGGEALSVVPGPIGQVGQKIATGEQKQLESPTLQPQNLAQQAGKTGTDIAEFFAPGGAEKSAVTKGASYIDKLPELLGLGGKAAGVVTGALKTALQSAVSGLSFGGVTAAQTGDLGKAKGAAELGAGTGVLGGALETFGPGISESLAKAGFRLSPATEAKTQKIADNAAKFISENKVTGTSATKYAKLNSLNTQLESTLQNSLPEGIAVPKNEIVDSINTSIEQLKQTDPAIYNQAKTKASQAINILNSNEGNIISVKDALNGKRSWAADAFKTAKKSKQDPTVSSEGAYAVEQAYQKALTGAFERSGGEVNIPNQLQKYFGGAESVSLGEFNKVYSDAINAKNLSFMSQFKNDAGLFGRLFGLWAGESIGQAISPGLGGKVIGGAAGEVLSTHLPGAVRNVSERVLSHPQAPEKAGKVIQAIENQSNP